MSKPPEQAVLRLKSVSQNTSGTTGPTRGVVHIDDAELSGVAGSPEDEEDGEQPLCRLRYLGDDDRWEFAFCLS